MTDNVPLCLCFYCSVFGVIVKLKKKLLPIRTTVVSVYL